MTPIIIAIVCAILAMGVAGAGYFIRLSVADKKLKGAEKKRENMLQIII